MYVCVCAVCVLCVVLIHLFKQPFDRHISMRCVFIFQSTLDCSDSVRLTFVRRSHVKPASSACVHHHPQYICTCVPAAAAARMHMCMHYHKSVSPPRAQQVLFALCSAMFRWHAIYDAYQLKLKISRAQTKESIDDTVWMSNLCCCSIFKSFVHLYFAVHSISVSCRNNYHIMQLDLNKLVKLCFFCNIVYQCFVCLCVM